MEKSVFFDHIRTRYGFIKRCRGPYLYTSKEVRLIDMYQEGGRAVLGWREGKSMQAMKSSLERGLWGDYPGLGQRRLEKALISLFSSCGVPEYLHFSWFYDSFLTDTKAYEPLLFPWNGLSLKESSIKSDIVYFIPPLPVPSLIIAASKNPSLLPPVQPLPEYVQEGLARSIYDLIDAFSRRNAHAFGLYDDVLSAYFERKGSSLIPKVSPEHYDRFVLHCLDCGIVLNPSPSYPSFVPYGVDKGVFNRLMKHDFMIGEIE